MNSNLISKNISVYFDDLINKPIITQPAKQSNIHAFYKNYVEHNLLLIIIIIFIIIFLFFKYYTKNLDDIEENYINNLNDVKEDYKKKDRKKNIEKERKIIERIKREKELLKKEKNEILSIIDELSEINYNRVMAQDIKEENIKDIKDIKEENIQDKKEENNKINNNINYEAYTSNENFSDDFYDIKENKSELIDGIYFETPYN